MSKDPLGIRNSSMDQLKKEVFEQLNPESIKYLHLMKQIIENQEVFVTVSDRRGGYLVLDENVSKNQIIEFIAQDGEDVRSAENFDLYVFPLFAVVNTPAQTDPSDFKFTQQRVEVVPGMAPYVGNDLGIQPFRYLEIEGVTYTRREGFRKLYGKYGVELDKVMTIHSEKVYSYFAKFYRAFARLLEALIDLVKGKSDSEQVILINNFLMSNFGLNISSLSKFEEVLATFRKQNLQKLVEIVHFLGFSLIISRDIDDTGRLPIVDEDFPEGGVVIKQSMSRGEVFQEIRLYRNPDLET